MNKISLGMKKLTALSSVMSYFLLSAQSVLAANESINIKAPAEGFKDIGSFTTNALTLMFGLALLVVLIMLIWGAFEWITSGGDKEAVGKARGRIINALIGLAVLAVAYALTKIGAQFIGIPDLTNIPIPTPNPQ